MGGLQDKRISRLKNVLGSAEIHLTRTDQSYAQGIYNHVLTKTKKVYKEYEIELLLRNYNYLLPVVVHGIDEKAQLPKFLQDHFKKDLVLSPSMAHELRIELGDRVTLISPAHVNSFMGDIPKTAVVEVDSFISTGEPDIDQFHLWLRLTTIQNLIRKMDINRIRIYDSLDFQKLGRELKLKFGEHFELKTWEEMNKSLLWSLRLETTVMVFLFTAMTMLVSLCIVLGLVVFFDKVKNDLTSFWILGASKRKLELSSTLLLGTMNLFAVLFGLFCGIVFLWVLDTYGTNIMPDVFVDRKIPIYISLRGIIVSFCVPFGISMFFSFFTVNQFDKDTSYLEHIRSFG